MAEAAGLVIGAVGLVSLASTVSDSFAKIETARNLGPDFIQIETELAVARLKYSRWLDAVRITDTTTGTSQSNVKVASTSEAKTVKNLLGGIENAFEKASKSSSKYLVEDVPQGATNASSVNADNRAVLATAMTERGQRHQKNANLFRKMKWSLHDKQALQVLATQVSGNVTNLVELFPATKAAQQAIAVEDVRAIAPVGHTELLEMLAAISLLTDPTLKTAADAEAKRQGHSYTNTRLVEKAKALYGNEIAAGAPASPYRHSYSSTYAGGETKVIYGDRVGFEKSILD